VELELGCPFEHSKIVPSQKLAVIDKVSSQSQNPESKLDKLRSRALSSLNFVFTPLNLIQQVTPHHKKKKTPFLLLLCKYKQRNTKPPPLTIRTTTTTTTNVSLSLSLCLAEQYSWTHGPPTSDFLKCVSNIEIHF
jgi:hypothetical protein